MIKDPHSPVAMWMRDMFPDPLPLMKEIRNSAGPAVIVSPDDIGHGTQGGAIDWWIRFLVDPQPPELHLVHAGLDKLKRLPVFEAAVPVFYFERCFDTVMPDIGPVEQLLTYDDETQARMCYVMSLITECVRADVENSRLFRLPAGSSPQDLLNLATEAEVSDLIRMRDAAVRVLLPHINGRVVCGPTFDGSRDLAADADMIIDGTLVEIKATRGARPRTDGTRRIRFEREDVYQLLGYLLMDYSDHYQIKNVGLYAVRFDCYLSWPIESFIAAAAGRTISVSQARESFKTLLRNEIPAYMSTKYGID